MSDTPHSGLPVAGYRPQTERAVEVVNTNKVMEERILRMIDTIQADAGLKADPRWSAKARTSIEEGFMFLNRSIFKPERVNIDSEY